MHTVFSLLQINCSLHVVLSMVPISEGSQGNKI